MFLRRVRSPCHNISTVRCCWFECNCRLKGSNKKSDRSMFACSIDTRTYVHARSIVRDHFTFISMKYKTDGSSRPVFHAYSCTLYYKYTGASCLDTVHACMCYCPARCISLAIVWPLLRGSSQPACTLPFCLLYELRTPFVSGLLGTSASGMGNSECTFLTDVHDAKRVAKNVK